MSLLEDFSLTPNSHFNDYQYYNQKNTENQNYNSPTISPISSPTLSSTSTDSSSTFSSPQFSFSSRLRRNSQENLLPFNLDQTTNISQKEHGRNHIQSQNTTSSKSIYNSQLNQSTEPMQQLYQFPHLLQLSSFPFQEKTTNFQRQKIKIRDDTELEFWQS